jgi:hypothetical protein
MRTVRRSEEKRKKRGQGRICRSRRKKSRVCERGLERAR